MNQEPLPRMNLSHYRLVSKIGAGGMGEVFLAQDTRLDRKVAIKFLNKELSRDVDKLNRFIQEAKAVSALNHPNILTIFEIGETDGANFIVTELIEGHTLREYLAKKESRSLNRTLKICLQTAEALAAAHEAGIIHRDIKPENIMIRPDGLVKVLDFGLAKLVEKQNEQLDTEGETRVQVKTTPGMIMGTVQYMSPEQTRGKATDGRSDIWSLGCVIYEMLGERTPFAGDTVADMIADIVKGHPAPLGKLVANIPERLEEIVAKTLEKDPDERYQTVKDLLIDLRRLKKKLELDLELDRSQSPISGRISDSENIATAASTAASDTGAGQTTISGTQAITSAIKRNKFGTAAILAVAAIVLAGFGYGLYRFLETPKPEQTRANQEIKTQRLTGDGRSGNPIISPDGKFLVFTKLEGGKQSLWIKQIETGSTVNVVKPGEFESFGKMTFSPDGNFVYFNARNASTESPTVFRVPTLGGTPVKFLSNANALQFSADGKRISFLRRERSQSQRTSAVFVANADGTNERSLATTSGVTAFYSLAVWSPDGKFLVAGFNDEALAPAPNFYIVLISVENGSVTEFGSKRWEGIDRLVWHPSGDSLIVCVSDNSFLDGQIWELAYPSGEYRRLTSNLNGYLNASITADGKSIVTGESYSRSAIWVSPDLKPENAKPVMPTTGTTYGMAWTPDGRIVYASDQSGSVEIWMMNADGSEPRQLTGDKIFKFSPTVSPDGKFIVYTTSQNGGQLVRIDSGGGNPVMLTKYNNSVSPQISPDGKWVIHFAIVSARVKIVRVPLEGGETQILSESFAASSPRYSNDGTKFACFLIDGSLAIVSADGGDPLKTFKIPPGTDVESGLNWTPDDHGIVFTVQAGESRNLWLQPIDSGEAKQITNLENPSVVNADYSRDGKRIALVRGDFVSNAIMITDFR